MASLSALMLASMHAVQVDHLRHHGHCFYHLEHHLFPAVPTSRLPELARRLDATDPQWSSKRVF